MRSNRRNLYLWLTLILAGLIFGSMLYVRITFHDRHEFVRHALRAVQMLTAFETVPEFILAHPGYQLLLIPLISIFQLTPQTAALIVSLSGYLWIAVILFHESYTRLEACPEQVELPAPAVWLRKKPGLAALIFTLTLMLISHIPFLVFTDRQAYFGYIGFNAYNSPTTNIIKPFSLLLFLSAARAVRGSRMTGWQTMVGALLTAASTISKPSFIICLLPGMAAFAGVDLLRFGRDVFKKLDWRWMVLAAAAPAGFILAWQYWLTFNTGGSSIMFSPFSMMQFYSDYLLLKLLASLLFPLAVTVVFLKNAGSDRSLILAWVMFAFGAFYTYFLNTDAGGNPEDGNFGWSSEVTLFVLFAAALFFWLEQIRAGAGRNRHVFLAAVLVLHLAAGIFYYVYSIRVDEWSFFPSLWNMLGISG